MKNAVMQRVVLVGVAMCVCLTGVLGQGTEYEYVYDDTLWVQVVFYDFRPTAQQPQSFNPDFNTWVGPDQSWYNNTGSWVFPGMVQNTLDADRKPVPTGGRVNEVSNSTNLAQWYRPSGSSGELNQFFYNSVTRRWEWSGLQNNPGYPNEWIGPFYNATDPMANIVIYDSLPFLYVPGTEGTYMFDEQAFFPLDNRGFGRDPLTSVHRDWGTFTNPDRRNYSFSMEIHTEFTYKPGLVFDFVGDDDVWAFIDNRLVMDLGGVHAQEPGRVLLDTMGLTEGLRYSFDFFYAERNVTGSTIRITTNILTPGRLRLDFIGDTVLVAGTEQDMLKAVLLDEAGNPITITSANVRWNLANPQEADRLSNPSPEIARLYGEVAHRTVTVVAEYTDPETGMILRATQSVRVVPGPASAVFIENVAGDTSAIDLHQPNPVDTIRLPIALPEARAYAVLRDRFNNYVGVASSAAWGSENPTAVAVAPLAGSNWTGVITRGPFVTQAGVTVRIQASSPGVATAGTAWVVVENEIQVQPPVATPPGGSGGLHHYENEVAVTLTPATEGSSIRYCLDCPAANPVWVDYTPGTPIRVSKRDTTILRAYAYIPGEGYIDSEVRTWYYWRVPPGSLPPVAVPGESTYRGSVEVVLQPNPDSDEGVTIYFFIDRTGRGGPADYGVAAGWTRYEGHTFTFSQQDPVTLYAYAVNHENINSPMVNWTYTNLDWEGPVITEAVYYLGNPPGAGPGTTNPDTLVITFNEPATFASLTSAQLASLFAYGSFNNLATGEEVFRSARMLESGIDTLTTVTLILENYGVVKPLRDSVGVVEGTLRDVWGNATPPNNKVVIRWGRNYDIIVGVAPNPVDFTVPGQRALLDALRGQVQGSLPPVFSLVKVESVDEIVVVDSDDPTGNSSGSETFMTVYDALGNVVRDGIRAQRMSNHTDVVFAWDLHNSNGRPVGSGTYLGIVSIRVLGGGVNSARVKMAVRR